MPAETAAEMGLAEFAKRVGASRQAVEKALKSGRLVTGVSRDKAGRWTVFDPDLAAAEFENNRDTAKSRENAPKSRENALKTPWQSTGDARRALILQQERKLRIANDLRERELVPRREFLLGYSGLVTQAKTVFLGLPSRAKQRLPHLTVEDVAILDLLVREALEQLAEGGEEA